MDQTLNQLGELLLSSIPTIFFLLTVWGAYRFLVHSKLQQTLAERHARTEGAMRQAQEDIASAEARTQEYERRLREARSHIYKLQESRRQQRMDQRNAALAKARQQAEAMIQQARAGMEQDAAAARAALQQQAESLADEMIHSILRPAVAVGGR